MRSGIQVTAARWVMPFLLLFSVFLLLRGHYEPGGGFVGGLVAAAAFSLLGFTESPAAVRQLLHLRPTTAIASGLLVALLSGVLALVGEAPFLAGRWGMSALPVLGKPGTPLLFDLGVYLVVLGTVLSVTLALLEAEE